MMVSHRSGHASIYYPSIPLSVGVKDGVRFPVSAQVTMAFSKADRCERNTKELFTTMYGVRCFWANDKGIFEEGIGVVQVRPPLMNTYAVWESCPAMEMPWLISISAPHSELEGSHKACQPLFPASRILRQKRSMENSELLRTQ